MATVSHHAMRRYPLCQPLDSPPQSHIPVPYFYPTTNQATEKSKKSWSQRLKLNKNEKSKSEKSLGNVGNNGGTAKPDSPSHDRFEGGGQSNGLARTMKYAEPWLYGTMRGIPAPLAHPGAALFQPMAEVAVVVCSCPEYLNGTKKEMKKASVCKKCRGSRLPLAPIGGTVRLAPNSSRILQQQQQHHQHHFYANGHFSGGGTMRLQSVVGTLKSANCKSRPTILSNPNDPYDLMRRSRLVAPDTILAKVPSNNGRNRAKSQSPNRNRMRRRLSPVYNEVVMTMRSARSRSAGRVSSCSNYSDDSWIEGPEDQDIDERSILRCDVNPYDLVMNNSPSTYSSIENNDADDEINIDSDDVDLNLHSRKYENILNPLFNKSSSGGGSSSNGNTNKKNLTNKTGNRTTEAASDHRKTKRTGTSKYSSSESTSVVQSKQTQSVDPPSPLKGPQDSRRDSIESTSLLNTANRLQRLPKGGGGFKIASENKGSESDIFEGNSTTVNSAESSTNRKGHIKSILKKYENITFPPDSHTPRSERDTEPFLSSAENQKQSANLHSTAKNANVNSNLHPRNNENAKPIKGQQQHYLHQSSKAATKPNSITTKPISNNSHNNLDKKHNNVNRSDVRKNSINVGSYGGSACNSGITTTAEDHSSQFYLPLPKGRNSAPTTTTTRKKVQFSDNNETFQKEHAEYDNNNKSNIIGTDEATESGRTNGVQLFSSEVSSTVNENGGHDCDSGKRSGHHKSAADESPKSEFKGRPTEQPSSLSDKSEFNDSDTSDSDTRPVLQRDGSGSGDAKCRKRSVRRSLSDRKLQIKAKENNQRLFNDTMALRIRVTKRDAREIDFNLSDRPKEPPPPPPTASSTPIKETAPTRPPRFRKLSQQSNSEVSIISSAEVDDNYELFNFNSDGKKREQNRVVMPVAPMIRVPDASAVHRLKVRHEDSRNGVNYDLQNFKKTSIMISGDDCYSTVNLNDETAIYQSSVVVNDMSSTILNSSSSATNTVTINVGTNKIADEIPGNGRKNSNNNKSVVPIIGESRVSISSSVDSSAVVLTQDQNGRTLISFDYKEVDWKKNMEQRESELGKLLRDPVEAVRLNLVPHVCGKSDTIVEASLNLNECNAVVKRKPNLHVENLDILTKKLQRNSFIAKLLEDPTLGHLAEGLENDIIAKLIESSLIRLKESRLNNKIRTTESEDDMTKLIDLSLQKIQEERHLLESKKMSNITNHLIDSDKDLHVDSVSSGNSYSSTNYEMFDFDQNNDSDCYQSCSSELTTEDDGNSTRSKFYQMLVDATLSEIEISTNLDDDHHYESIRLNNDPIYEEISEIPPPLPLTLPPGGGSNNNNCGDVELEKKCARSMFEGASKYDILSYLVDAKERGVIPEESYMYNFSNTSDIIIEEGDEEDQDHQAIVDKLHKRQSSDVGSRISDSSDDTVVSLETKEKLMSQQHRKSSTDIERNDSGVGSETSKSSRNKFLNLPGSILDKNSPIHLCEDCDGPVETQVTDSGVMYAPLVCRKCGKKRAERKEIVTEIVETEEKYGRDLQIILEEFYQPMLVAGLLTQDQLSAIFLNTEELLENNQALAERMRDALDIASEQGDDDLLTCNVGKLFLDAAPMLHAFETYCVGQAASSLLLANLEKEKELLRIFLRVSQMENTVLRRMNLNSFLMVPVQRVTKYPLLLARLYKVTPPQLEGRLALKQAQEKIELHLNHMNREAKDIPTKLWRRISSSCPRRSSCEIDMINIKLRKMAVDILEWNHEEVRFAMEGKLLFTQPTDNNWRKGRTIKLTPINALLVTNGKPSNNYRADRALNDPVNFPHHTGIREASLLLVREKSGRYTLLRDPLYLDRCIICSEADWADYFEVQEISSKDTFIFKAEDGNRTKQWYTQLQYHAQGMGAWRKRRNALANIMINGMMMRS